MLSIEEQIQLRDTDIADHAMRDIFGAAIDLTNAIASARTMARIDQLREQAQAAAKTFLAVADAAAEKHEAFTRGQ